MGTEAKQRLVYEVRRRAEGTGYEVTETAEGFRVERDLSDVRWWGPMHEAGVKRLTAHQVTLDEAAHRLTITDETREVEWRTDAGALQPHWGANASIGSERLAVTGTRGFRDEARLAAVENCTVATMDGGDIVRGAAEQLGWSESVPASIKVGVVAAVAGGGLVVLVVAGLVMALVLDGF